MGVMETSEDFWRRVGEAFRGLKPEIFVGDAARPISVALVAEEPDKLRRMEEFFVPRLLGPRKAEQVRERLCSFVLPLGKLEREGLGDLDLVIGSPGAARQLSDLLPRIYIFFAQSPQSVVNVILKERRDLALPLARNFLPFRRAVDRRSMRSIALENALFAILTAVPDVWPAPFSRAKGAGDLASSTAFLTANQLRLAFLIAAANDSAVGFREQTGQITTIAAASLGWRSLARELSRRVSPAGGLVVKGLLAFAATYGTGLVLEQFHRLGCSMTCEAKTVVFEEAYRVGRRVLAGMLGAMASGKGAGA